MAVVAVVIAPFFTAIIIATQQAVGASSPSDVVLILLVGLRQIRFGLSRIRSGRRSNVAWRFDRRPSGVVTSERVTMSEYADVVWMIRLTARAGHLAARLTLDAVGWLDE